VSYFHPKTSQRSTLDAATQDFWAKNLFRENIFMFRYARYTQNSLIRVLPPSKSHQYDVFWAQVVHGIAEYVQRLNDLNEDGRK
jgi:hypothetical protein